VASTHRFSMAFGEFSPIKTLLNLTGTPSLGLPLKDTPPLPNTLGPGLTPGLSFFRLWKY